MGVILKSFNDKYPRKYKIWSREKRTKIRYALVRGRKAIAKTWRKVYGREYCQDSKLERIKE